MERFFFVQRFGSPSFSKMASAAGPICSFVPILGGGLARLKPRSAKVRALALTLVLPRPTLQASARVLLLDFFVAATGRSDR